MKEDYVEFRKIYKHLSHFTNEEIKSHLENQNNFENRKSFESLYEFDFSYNKTKNNISNTLIIHIYYPKIVVNFEAYICNALICGANIIVNIPEHTNQDINFIEEFFDRFMLKSKIKIIKSQNTGRDWGGLYKAFKDGSSGEIITFIHTKFSPHLHPVFGMLWRHRLISPLLGSTTLYSNNLKIISDNNASLIASEECRINSDNTNSNEEFKEFDSIFTKKLSKGKEDYPFIPGSMFMVKKEILNQIFNKINLLPSNGLEENYNKISLENQLDGKLPHYLERLIFNYSHQLNGVISI